MGMKRISNRYYSLWVLVTAFILIAGFSQAADIVASIPENGAEEVPVDTEIVIRFNTSMDKVSVEQNLLINPSLGDLGYQLTWSNNDKDLTITPAEELEPSRDYTILLTGAEDYQGNVLEDAVIMFSTEEEEYLDLSIVLYAIIFFIIAFIVFLIGYAMASRGKEQK
jgi:hypothetical protein